MQETSEPPIGAGEDHFSTSGWMSEVHTLLCIACNESFEGSPYKPRLRCPNCNTIGYPDRAGRNLVSVGWECFECHAWNTGRTNFCMACGAGLASRCLKCEFPVYASVCQRCGSHQDALRRLKSIQADRDSWVPVQRSYIEAQEQKEAAQHANQTRHQRPVDAAPQPVDTQSVTGSPSKDWLQVGQQARQAAQQPSQSNISQRASRFQRFAVRARLGGLIAMLAGALWLLRSVLPIWAEAAARSAPGTAVLQLAARWWIMAQAIAASNSAVDTSSPDYALFFGATLFAIAAAPPLLYVLFRGIRSMVS